MHTLNFTNEKTQAEGTYWRQDRDGRRELLTANLILTLHIMLPLFSFGNHTFCGGGGMWSKIQMINVNLMHVLIHNWYSDICGVSAYVLSRGLTVLSTLTVNYHGPSISRWRTCPSTQSRTLQCRAWNFGHIPGIYTKIIRYSNLMG